jgi:hypothetical protein
MITDHEIIRYLDGDLDAYERAAFERALKDSEELQARVERKRAASEALKRLGTFEPNADYAARGVARFRERQARAKERNERALGGWRFGAITAIAATIAFFTFLPTRDAGERTDPTSAAPTEIVGAASAEAIETILDEADLEAVELPAAYESSDVAYSTSEESSALAASGAVENDEELAELYASVAPASGDFVEVGVGYGSADIIETLSDEELAYVYEELKAN